METQRRKFNREFKLEAVKRVREREVSASQVARDLDLHENVRQHRSASGCRWMKGGVTSLLTDALMMAIWRRGKPDVLLHHSDQGS